MTTEVELPVANPPVASSDAPSEPGTVDASPPADGGGAAVQAVDGPELDLGGMLPPAPAAGAPTHRGYTGGYARPFKTARKRPRPSYAAATRRQSQSKAKSRRGVKPEPAWKARARLIVAAALLGLLGLQLHSLYGWQLQTHTAGTILVSNANDAPFAQVLRFEADHRFANGAVADAYLIQPVNSTDQRWLTRSEVNQLTRPAN